MKILGWEAGLKKCAYKHLSENRSPCRKWWKFYIEWTRIYKAIAYEARYMHKADGSYKQFVVYVYKI